MDDDAEAKHHFADEFYDRRGMPTIFEPVSWKRASVAQSKLPANRKMRRLSGQPCLTPDVTFTLGHVPPIKRTNADL